MTQPAPRGGKPEGKIIMKQKLLIATALIVGVALAAQAQKVKITGADNVSLGQLARSSTLVTVVLALPGSPEDPNLNIIEVQSTYFSAIKPDGEKVTYTYELVAELRVQGGEVEAPDYAFLNNRSLRPDEQDVVNAAWKRVEDLYANANRNQGLKIQAASLLALRGDDEAIQYLNRLTESNDYSTQFAAAIALYCAGLDTPTGLIEAGFESGQLDVRIAAAHLAGITGDRGALPELYKLLNDRSADLSAPAAIAIALIGDRAVIPKLFAQIMEINDKKGDAARDALVILGGDEVIQELKLRLASADGLRRFRMVEALHRLGDPHGTELLRDALANTPTLAPMAAMALAKAGEWEGAQYIREKLDQRENPTRENKRARVLNAAALITGGDSDATAILQDELHSEFQGIKVTVCNQIWVIGQRRLMPLLRPGIGNIDPLVSLRASMAAIAFADPEYRERILKVRTATGQ